VVLPTDTVYGVAAHVGEPDALDALFALKGRRRDHPLAVLVADVAQAHELVDLAAVPAAAEGSVLRMLEVGWPGALTVVLPRRAAARAVDLGGDADAIGLRCPASDLVRAIAERVGPLATTSANRTGEPTPRTAAAAAGSLRGSVGLVIDAGPCTEPPSTVVDATTWPMRVLRQGSVRPEDLGLDPSWALPPDAPGAADSVERSR
jgi:tRNA threonylcarbamoyl adenosine modification protein (Sua5/YciO/YrdC/YwlC family)